MHQRFIQLLDVICLIVIGLLPWPLTTAAQNFEVEGSLTWEVYAKGQTLRTSERMFRVIVAGSQWSIQTVFPEGVNEGKTNFMFFDGTNIFSMTRIPRSEIDLHRLAVDAIGAVTTSEVPRFDSTAATPLWLAYCSRAYFGDRSEFQPHPVWEMPSDAFDSPDYPITARCDYFSSAKSLPSRVDYWNRGLLWLDVTQRGSTIVSSNRSILLNKEPTTRFLAAPVPYNKGFLNARYETPASTNLAGMQLPLTFKLTRFKPADKGTEQTDVQAQWKIEGSVRLCTLSKSGPGFPFDTVNRTIVFDKRYTKRTPRF